MRNLLLLLTLAIFALPQNSSAQEDYLVTLSVDSADADWNNFPGWVTFYGEIHGPQVDFPVGPTIEISYWLDDPAGEADGYRGVFEAIYSEETGSYSIAFEMYGGMYQNTSTIYFRGHMTWLDWGTLEIYAQHESHPDSIIAIDLPWIVTSVGQGEMEVFSAYPNPTTGELSLTGLGDTKTVSIHDVFGRVVLITPAYHTIGVHQLTPGCYMLQTDTGVTQRFVKN